jgi:multiple sugar transport system permease protein
MKTWETPVFQVSLQQDSLSTFPALQISARSVAPRTSFKRRQSLVGFLFIVPALAYFAFFSFWPMLNAAYLSLFDYDLLTPPKWVGLAQYQNLAHSPVFIESLKVTAIYTFGISVPIWTLSLLLGMLLNQNIRFRTFFRTIFFSPVVMPLVVLAVIWSLLFHPYGPVNSVLLAPFTNQIIPWLNSTQHALIAVIILAVWRATGYYAIIFLAGLQNISTEYYEAARLDGAGTWVLFRHITWPLLKPTTLFVVVISIINALRHFDAIWVMTGGGPGDATRVLSVLIYETGWVFLKMGSASAMSIVLFAFVFIFTIIQLRLFRSEV